MTDTIVRPPLDERPTAIPLLPTEPRRMGPATRFLVLRLLACIAVVELVGTVLVVLGGTTARAAGLSLVFPGAGFLYSAHPLLFVLTWVLMSVALGALVGDEPAPRHPRGVAAERSGQCAAGGSPATVRRSRHHVGLGRTRCLRARCGVRGGAGVDVRVAFPPQAGTRPRAERVPPHGRGARAVARVA